MSQKFSPPGHLADFDPIPHQGDAWHVVISSFFKTATARIEAYVGRGKSQFYDPTKRHPRGTSERAITWSGFPKVLTQHRSREEALKAAEQLIAFNLEDGRRVKARPQDEYLEWHATRDRRGRIVAVDFTCEGPEYWSALAHGYPDSVKPHRGAPAARGDLDSVVKLYQRHVSPDVKRGDLLRHGRYDPYNKWNTELGAMHLTHPSNSLSAEVFLAGDATVLREEGGRVLEDDDELIRCAQYGEPGRASDPTIGGTVNALARAGALISLRDPVGLYIDSLDTTGWTKPDGTTPVGDWWKVVRGERGATLRARYEVPSAEGFAISDILIGGEKIALAGQIAERITMKLTGVAGEPGEHGQRAVSCEGIAAPAPVTPHEAPAELVHLHARRYGGSD